jgi:type IV pilus assembly protein PilM
MPVLAVEFGERVTRVCVASYSTKKKWRCGRALTFETPAGLVDDGAVTDPEALGRWFAVELAQRRVRTRKAVFSITSGRITARAVNLPPVRRYRVKGLIAANAGEYFPSDVSGYLVEHTVFEYPPKRAVPGAGTDPPRIRAGVYAAPLPLLEGYARTAAAAGLRLQSMDYSGNGRYRVYASAPLPGVTAYLYADIGFTCLTFMRGGALLLQRTLDFGVEGFVDEYAVAEGGGLTAEEALARLADPRNEERVYALLGENGVANALSRLAGGVRRVRNQFDSNFGLETVVRTVLAGPCAGVAGLREMLGSVTGDREILPLRELPGINRAVAEYPAHINCLGALVKPMGFMPGEHKAQERRRRRGQFEYRQNMVMAVSVAASALLVLAAAVCPVAARLAAGTAVGEKARIEEQIAALAYAGEAYDAMAELEEGASALAALRESLVSPNDGLVAFLGDMEKKMPSGILVMSMSCSREGVSMSVTVPTKTDAARVLVQFRNFESIQNITVSSVSESGGNDPRVSFSLVCEYFVPETAEEEGRT